MLERTEFLRLLWSEVIESSMRGYWIDNSLAMEDKHPDAPEAELGRILKRLLASGVSRDDLCRVARYTSYDTVFAVLYLLENPGIEGVSNSRDNDAVCGLSGELLAADPSGKEGKME